MLPNQNPRNGFDSIMLAVLADVDSAVMDDRMWILLNVESGPLSEGV